MYCSIVKQQCQSDVRKLEQIKAACNNMLAQDEAVSEQLQRIAVAFQSSLQVSCLYEFPAKIRTLNQENISTINAILTSCNAQIRSLKSTIDAEIARERQSAALEGIG
jgi:hypothetical protein